MTPGTITAQITDYANRADPYPLYAELREQPVRREDDGTYLVSTYYEVRNLANDPRLSNDTRNRPPGYARVGHPAEETGLPPSFIFTDPPVHDRLRDTINRPFGPPHSPRFLDGLRADLATVVTELLDAFEGKDQVDIVEDFSYPLPVTAICKVLGVPREDEPRFHIWADALASSLDPRPGGDDGQEKAQRARQDMGAYLSDLIETKRRHPGPGILSALAPDMTPADLEATAVLLLVAGHETTVNAITNTTLTLLRHPDVLERFQKDPDLAVPLIEEVLRFEPPVQFVPWTTALADIDVAGTTIPKGSPVWLMLAAANRDPKRFEDPDRFDPDRKDNEHLGFYTGIHYCFGAPLARIELHAAVPELFRRVKFSGLLEDPPPYRTNAVLRGPRHLPVAIEGLTA
ncbi:cytochrome P450 [Kitasatospora aureofaciens]|uniref:Cytochrome n=1 Tax=Kitasatospora aureofaciens TaxID=1894 RepID=A0A1E7N9N4_KITAU|nr:cytochrome P450 [Kitasatospora aureofaciens]ARF82492.1 cytochrome P450 [Kitasatospora aureofaciens]OEV37378.1 cytochrome [Kitasatospora aureofaciens]GGV00304.1 cytochrome P450 [Kitasatospora aureofaciens]